MKTIQQQLAELNQMVLAGKSLEAFDRFYHPDIIMQENESTPTIGKEANRLREIEFYSNVEEFRGAEVRGVTVGENLSTVIWHYDYTHRVLGKRNYTQVSVQHWNDGLIVKEQFFYGN